MKKSIIVPLMLALAAAPAAARPAHKHSDTAHFYDRARVIDVEPIISVVQIPDEQRECWTEEIHGTRHRHDHGGALVGSIIGGVIGHHIGHGDRGSTAAGSIIGAAVGSRHNHHYEEPYTHTEHHCQINEVYHEEERIEGYRVSYRYKGETFSTRMQRDPGKFIRLQVKLTPVD